MITCILQVCDQQQEVRMDQLLNQIPDTTLSEELIVDTKGAAKEGKHTAYFHKHPKSVVDNLGYDQDQLGSF